MKKFDYLKKLKLSIIVVFLAVASLNAQKVKAMTYNIKYDNKSDTINNWNNRKEKMVAQIIHYAPLFLGIQEGLYNQVVYLNESLKNYNFIGVGRDDGKEKGEYSAIFYNSEKYKVLENGTFWLSETPNKISVGWDASMERICSYGLFQNKKTKDKHWVFNAHFDHIGKLARQNSAQLIINKIRELNKKNFPVILMGDFNLTPETKGISILTSALKDTYQASKNPVYGPKGTFNGFTNRVMKNRIDYIFVNGFKVKQVIQIDDRLDNNKHISDHIPVLAILAKSK